MGAGRAVRAPDRASEESAWLWFSMRETRGPRVRTSLLQSLSLSTAPLMCFSHGTLFTAEGKEAGIILPSRAAGKVPLCRFPLVEFISTS